MTVGLGMRLCALEYALIATSVGRVYIPQSMKESGPKKLERDRRKRAREAREAREKARAAPPARTTRHNTTTNSR